MMKPMNKEQRDQLADEYWKWFEGKELKKWIVFSLEKVKFFSNGKHLKTMLVEDKIYEIFNEFPNDKDKNWSKATDEFKVRFKESGKKIHGSTNNKTVLENIMKSKYEKFNFGITLPSESEIGLSPKVQYRILRTCIYKICQKLVVRSERKLLSKEEKIKLTMYKLSTMKKKNMDSLIQDLKKFKVTKIKNNGVTDDIDEEVSKKVIKDFFISGYERMRNSEFKHKFLFKYFPVCPYCNATHLFKLREEDIPKDTKNYVGAQLDHYYPKDDYPYLAISIFNLIPSCPTCNHIKSNKKEPHLYPYTEEVGDNAKFIIEASFYAELNGITFDSKEDNRDLIHEGFKKIIKLDIKEGILKDKIKNSNSVFQLENKYSNLKEEIKDLYFKHMMTSDSFKDELVNQFSNLNLTESEIKEIYYGVKVKEDQHHKRPLSKFINDLINDLNNR